MKHDFIEELDIDRNTINIITDECLKDDAPTSLCDMDLNLNSEPVKESVSESKSKLDSDLNLNSDLYTISDSDSTCDSNLHSDSDSNSILNSNSISNLDLESLKKENELLRAERELSLRKIRDFKQKLYDFEKKEVYQNLIKNGLNADFAEYVSNQFVVTSKFNDDYDINKDSHDSSSFNNYHEAGDDDNISSFNRINNFISNLMQKFPRIFEINSKSDGTPLPQFSKHIDRCDDSDSFASDFSTRFNYIRKP